MHFDGTSVREQALTLLRDGARNVDVARRLGVPVGTVGHWKHDDRARRGECPGTPRPQCPRCQGGTLDRAAYAYLLGLYLGDGHIVQNRTMRVPKLSVACADAWPGLIEECAGAMRAVLPANRVSQVRRQGCRQVAIYSKHLYCLFPQHGPGRKHERRIALDPWQREIVEAHPWEFVKGLIHSDGCRITNWATRLVAGEKKRYEYPRYFFTNSSADIIGLLTATLDRLGVAWKRTRRSPTAWNVSIARRESVALMDRHIGPKH